MQICFSFYFYSLICILYCIIIIIFCSVPLASLSSFRHVTILTYTLSRVMMPLSSPVAAFRASTLPPSRSFFLRLECGGYAAGRERIPGCGRPTSTPDGNSGISTQMQLRRNWQRWRERERISGRIDSR